MGKYLDIEPGMTIVANHYLPRGRKPIFTERFFVQQVEIHMGQNGKDKDWGEVTLTPLPPTRLEHIRRREKLRDWDVDDNYNILSASLQRTRRCFNGCRRVYSITETNS